MPHTSKNFQVNLLEFPENITPAKEKTIVTIGDLHGNSMKLMFMLIAEGIAINVDDTNYQKLWKIYETRVCNLTKENINEFNSIIDGIQFNKNVAIRLIGDEVGDRGSNDYFTLRILENLRKAGVSLDIEVSNHGIELLLACEYFPKTKNLCPQILGLGQAISLENLNSLENRKLISVNEVLRITEEAYKPTLKAIAYTLNQDNSEISIYSHAAIGLNTIRKFAEEFEITYQDFTAIELGKTIDGINLKFQEYVKAGNLHTLYSKEKKFLFDSETPDLRNYPLIFAIWNRRYDVDIIERPSEQNSYKLVYIHGHDNGVSDPLKSEKYIYNLDNHLGKPSYNEGTYNVLITNDYQTLTTELEENVQSKNTDKVRGSSYATMAGELREFVTVFMPLRYVLNGKINNKQSAIIEGLRSTITFSEDGSVENISLLENIVEKALSNRNQKIAWTYEDACKKTNLGDFFQEFVLGMDVPRSALESLDQNSPCLIRKSIAESCKNITCQGIENSPLFPADKKKIIEQEISISTFPLTHSLPAVAKNHPVRDSISLEVKKHPVRDSISLGVKISLAITAIVIVAVLTSGLSLVPIAAIGSIITAGALSGTAAVIAGFIATGVFFIGSTALSAVASYTFAKDKSVDCGQGTSNAGTSPVNTGKIRPVDSGGFDKLVPPSGQSEPEAQEPKKETYMSVLGLG